MANSFRLMTANLLVERCDPSDFARVVAAADPDVVVAQELAPPCADVMAATFPNHQLRPSFGFEGRGVATRFDAEFSEIEMPGRPGTATAFDLGGNHVRLAGIHLLNPILFPWWVMARLRGEQLRSVHEWLDEGDGPVVVAGDFNASPRWPAYKDIIGRLVDLVDQHADQNGSKPQRTWAWRPGWPRMLRIDHVFGGGVVARHVAVEPITGTDHAAVIVDIEVVQSPVPRSKA